tara:strand:+ start:7 stop:549 length:543 start_codon:yes stop_codon:yes gene_type:complete
MATYDATQTGVLGTVGTSGLGAGTHPSRAIRKEPYKVEVTLDLAKIASGAGTALASSDILQCIDVPAKSLVWAAGLETVTAPASPLNFKVDMGITTTDPDAFLDDYSAGGTSAGGFGQQPATYQPYVVSTADTIDLLLGPTGPAASYPSAGGTGILRAWAVLQDISDDLGPDEVDRDQLA